MRKPQCAADKAKLLNAEQPMCLVKVKGIVRPVFSTLLFLCWFVPDFFLVVNCCQLCLRHIPLRDRDLTDVSFLNVWGRLIKQYSLLSWFLVVSVIWQRPKKCKVTRSNLIQYTSDFVKKCSRGVYASSALMERHLTFYYRPYRKWICVKRNSISVIITTVFPLAQLAFH